jgi:hypothetical protein
MQRTAGTPGNTLLQGRPVKAFGRVDSNWQTGIDVWSRITRGFCITPQPLPNAHGCQVFIT